MLHLWRNRPFLPRSQKPVIITIMCLGSSLARRYEETLDFLDDICDVINKYLFYLRKIVGGYYTQTVLVSYILMSIVSEFERDLSCL